MEALAFTTGIAVGVKAPLVREPMSAQRPALRIVRGGAARTGLRMSVVADKYQCATQTKDAKQVATSTGVYTVQCTEGTGGSNIAEATRLASLANNFRLRQSSLSARFADLYETRRAAIVNAHGSHAAEGYAVKFPSRASASVIGRAEALRACSRYFPNDNGVDEYMYKCVDNQYRAAKVPGGVYNTARCCDGRLDGEAETARIAALAADFRSRQFTTIQKTQMRYNAIQEGIALARGGCDYEENYFSKFPKTAAAMRYTTGAYAASIVENSFVTGGQLISVSEQIQGDNVLSYNPSFLRRPAIERTYTPWTNKILKDYSYMSPAAVKFGVDAQATDEGTKEYANVWEPGWQPKSSVLPCP